MNFVKWCFNKGYRGSTALRTLEMVRTVENKTGKTIGDISEEEARAVLLNLRHNTRRNYLTAFRRYKEYLQEVDNQ